MRLYEILKNLDYKVSGEIGDIEIEQIAYDSRRVVPGCLFVCLRGSRADGHDYAAEAINSGAAALVVERKLNLDCPQILVDNTRRALAVLAVNYYGYPAESLILAGVTGTNGKTTTVHMLKSIAEKKYKSALTGTVGLKIGRADYRFLPNTSPESLDFQALLDELDRGGVEFVAAEISSHGLKAHRLDHCRFDLAVFANLSRDHLDFHANIEDYFASKDGLFAMLKDNNRPGAVVNTDDDYGHRLYESLDRSKTLSFGIKKPADCCGRIIKSTIRETVIDIACPGESFTVNLPLCFEYNAYNALAAAAGALALGFEPDEIIAGLEELPQVPGRMQRVDINRDFEVFIDYAHTPDGLEKVLAGLDAFKKNRIILVFGCVGDGDKENRPEMAGVAEKYADLIVVTTDQPRYEDPEAIAKDIVAGFAFDRFTVLLDRTSAVAYALERAEKGDIVLLAGLGHEQYQKYEDEFIPYSDYSAVLDYFQKR